MSEKAILVFNSEHDLCLANNDVSFVPPESACRFSRDCGSIMRFLPDSHRPITVWGWDKTIRHRLLLDGANPSLLPSDEYLQCVRELSHRRTAILCNDFIRRAFPSRDWMCDAGAVEAFDLESVRRTVDLYEDTILKSPWSSSGRGLRMVSSTSWTESDLGWCRNIIAKQGSVIVERRSRDLAMDFSMQFGVSAGSVHFRGYSIFRSVHGAYQGNLLASNDFMASRICAYIAPSVLEDVRKAVQEFISEQFAGRYEGNLGVDMFIARGGQGGYTLNPCVEINVRNNMGLVARNLFDSRFSAEHPGEDGTFQMSVLYSPDYEELCRLAAGCTEVLTPEFDASSHYVIGILPVK